MSLELTINDAKVLRPDGFTDTPAHIAQGIFTDRLNAPSLSLPDHLLLPGIIDIHGDGFERHLAPRRGVMRNLRDGLISTDAELASNGITTAVLAQFYSWEGGMRGPEFAKKMFESLDAARADLGTDYLIQLRFETHLLSHYERVEALIARHNIPYVVFNDHIPHDALAKGKRPPRLTGQALKSGRSPEAHLALLTELHDNAAQVPDALRALSARLQAKGVLMGSHDDHTVEDRAGAFAMGHTVSEFPETREAAQCAQAQGAQIVLGAPNVVRGGSHSGNESAAELAADGLCDCLASDYHYPALKQAAFLLSDQESLPFEDAWGLISSGPARALGLQDRGMIETGKRADFVLIHKEKRRIEATVSGGKFTYVSGTVAQQLATRR